MRRSRGAMKPAARTAATSRAGFLNSNIRPDRPPEVSVRAGLNAGATSGELTGKLSAMKLVIAFACAVVFVSSGAFAEESFPKEQIAAGAELYAVNCSPCHGARLQDPGAAFNLRKFPPDQRERFVSSITRGKNQMPPWGDFFKPDQLDALWAYIMAGER